MPFSTPLLISLIFRSVSLCLIIDLSQSIRVSLISTAPFSSGRSLNTLAFCLDHLILSSDFISYRHHFVSFSSWRGCNASHTSALKSTPGTSPLGWLSFSLHWYNICDTRSYISFISNRYGSAPPASVPLGSFWPFHLSLFHDAIFKVCSGVSSCPRKSSFLHTQ